MHLSLIEILACPRCQGALRCEVSQRISAEEISAGTLACVGCAAEYPIVNGIPRFVPTGNYASSFGYQWNRFRKEQLDTCNGTQLSARRFWSETEWEASSLRGKWVLDAGCGAGRFLDVVSRDGEAQVVGLDISNAVDAAAETLAGRRNLHFVQASIFEMPFRRGTFDAVYSIGVIQHTPDPARATQCISDMVGPGGRLALTVYEHRGFTHLYSKYWLRPLTRRMKSESLLTAIRVMMPAAFAVSEVLFRLPVVGRGFRFLIPVANYVDATDLTLRQRYQWAVLDTFDMLAPAYDAPQRESDLLRLLEAAGIGKIRRLPNPGLNLIGTRAAQ
jgi:2-polyprenyl-3-methyl-5-hydroxy-6-metoxy-1,4-benzoquinol methylase/uncharacterized protein YbaR (Trm112 family)